MSSPLQSAGAKGPSDAFLRSEEQVETYLREGFQVLASFPGPGSMRYAPEEGKTVYVRAMPEWMGEVGSADYQKALFDAAQWLAERTKGKITYWQVANEPDIDIFYGPLTKDQNIGFLMTAARGLLAGNPDAKPGINLGYINDYARLLMREMYAIPDSPFAYLGIDGYMGSWQLGGPETWVSYIDETARLSGKPILINEWGFSSLQWGEEVHRPGAQELLQPAGLLLQALAVHLGQGAYPGGAGALRPAVPEDLRRPSGGDRELLLPVERRAHLLAVRRAGLPGRMRLGVRGR